MVKENLNSTTSKASVIVEKTANSIQSEKEKEIRNAIAPIPTPENESEKQIEELGISGILMNSEEIKKWQSKGGNLKKHKLREGPTHKIINKNMPKPIEYEQNIIVKYLKPPTPPPINIILEERPRRIIPAPPLVVRLPRRPPYLPATKIIREPLPKPPTPGPDIVIPIRGRDYHMPRKVIKEIIEPLRAPPPNIIIEKWLPYKQPSRKVILKQAPVAPIEDEGKILNLVWPLEQEVDFKKIIVWPTPEAIIKETKTQFKKMLSLKKNAKRECDVKLQCSKSKIQKG